MTVAAHLRAARALIAEPGAWIQGASNRNADGETFVPESEAVCWCAVGAILHDPDWRSEEMYLLREATGSEHIPTWNDDPTRTHAEVLAAFDRAIALAEAGE